MPKRGRKFITEFLIPNLNEGKFGTRLAWVSQKHYIFQIQWSHKGASEWTEKDCEVFTEWDKKQGHYKPMDKEYYSKSKQRFRAVLYKLIRDEQITPLNSDDKNTKIYCFGNRNTVSCDFSLDKTCLNYEDVINNTFTEDVGQRNGSPAYDSITYPHQEGGLKKNSVSTALKDHSYLNNKARLVSRTNDDTVNSVPSHDCTLFSSPNDAKNFNTYLCGVCEIPTVHVDVIESMNSEKNLESQSWSFYMDLNTDMTTFAEKENSPDNDYYKSLPATDDPLLDEPMLGNMTNSPEREWLYLSV